MNQIVNFQLTKEKTLKLLQIHGNMMHRPTKKKKKPDIQGRGMAPP